MRPGPVPQSQQLEVPPLTGRVVDRADLLSSSTEERLSATLAAHEDSTGNQIAVLTIPSLQGEVLEQYSLRVARTWALGTSEFDNGVLLLIARDDRKMRIEVGYGLEGALPDITAAQIIRYELRPAFRAGDFDRGVRNGVDAVINAIEGEYSAPESASSGSGDWAERFVVGLIFLVMSTLFASQAVFASGCGRWVLFFFFMPFVFAAGAALTNSGLGGLAFVGIYAVLFIAAARYVDRRGWPEKIEEAKESGERVRIGWFTIHPSTWSSGSGSGGSSFSSGGGGFSGGGGSFGGGGASGGW